MKRIKFLLLALALSFNFVALAPVGVGLAYDPFAKTCQQGGANSTICDDRDAGADNPLTGTEGTIMDVVNIIAFAAGAAAVIFIVLAGLRMITSNGSADDIAGARRTIIYAAIGLVVLIFARTIVAFILGKI